MSVSKELFGVMPDGREVYEFILENNNETRVGILTLGATLHTIITKDRKGESADILLGFDDVEGYLSSSYQGAVVGPYANRIGGGCFSVDGTVYNLVKNENNITCLHSGGEFSYNLWKSIIIDTDAVEFSFDSPDGCNGFPGNLHATVVYRLGENDDLHIQYKAVSDKKTYINLTNHAYFNLAGFSSGTILNQELMLAADAFTPVDEYSITTGEILPVEGTPFDFRTSKPIGKDIDMDCVQLKMTGGFDHNFCVRDADGTMRKCAAAKDAASGRELHVYTTMPGVQFYCGNFLKGEKGKEGKPMEKRSGFCLETQYYPDSPNKPGFPSCLFDAGEEFKSETVFYFENDGDSAEG